MLFMTDEEIRKAYKEARDRRGQISILAQLNCTTEKTIADILGVELEKRTHAIRIQEDAFRKLYDEGKNDREIAEALGVNKSSVTAARNRLKLPPNIMPAKGSEAEKRIVERGERIKELYNQGKSDKEIAAILECSKSTVHYERQRLGLPRSGPYKRGGEKKEKNMDNNHEIEKPVADAEIPPTPERPAAEETASEVDIEQKKSQEARIDELTLYIFKGCLKSPNVTGDNWRKVLAHCEKIGEAAEPIVGTCCDKKLITDFCETLAGIFISGV